jgi:hypothetical protein
MTYDKGTSDKIKCTGSIVVECYHTPQHLGTFFLMLAYNQFEPLDLGVVFSSPHPLMLGLKAMTYDNILV